MALCSPESAECGLWKGWEGAAARGMWAVTGTGLGGSEGRALSVSARSLAGGHPVSTTSQLTGQRSSSLTRWGKGAARAGVGGPATCGQRPGSPGVVRGAFWPRSRVDPGPQAPCRAGGPGAHYVAWQPSQGQVEAAPELGMYVRGHHHWSRLSPVGRRHWALGGGGVVTIGEQVVTIGERRTA